MFGLVVMEGMTLSGNFSNINGTGVRMENVYENRKNLTLDNKIIVHEDTWL